MILELIEEINPTTGTMYVVKKDDINIKWFSQKEDAEKFYDEIIANPDLLKPVKNILKSQEIDVSLDK